MSLTLRNPHAVLAALKERPSQVRSVHLPLHGSKSSEAWKEVAQLAEKKRVPILAPKVEVREERRRNYPSDGRASDSYAMVDEKKPISIEELFSLRKPAGEGYSIFLALDCIQDPHNLGAIFRTAAFFGVSGIVLTEERSAGLTPTVYDVSTGGVECVPFSIQGNLRHALEAAKKNDLWILGTSEHAEGSLFKVERDRHWLVVLGNEESGLRRLTLDSCDVTCAIPVAPGSGVTSLNVSVACGVVLGWMGRG